MPVTVLFSGLMLSLRKLLGFLSFLALPALATHEIRTPPAKWQVRGSRTQHSGAQWFPDAGLGLFLHWGIVSAHGKTGDAWDMRWSKEKARAGKKFYPLSELVEVAERWNPTNYHP